MADDSLCDHYFVRDADRVIRCSLCKQTHRALEVYGYEPYADRDPWHGHFSEAQIRDAYNPDEGDKR